MNDVKELVLRARQSDEQAIRMLIDKVNQKAVYIALSYTNNDYQKAEDIVQNTIIKTFSKLETLDNPNRFEPWFYKSLHNEARDSIREKQIYKNSSYFSELEYDDSKYEDSLLDDKVEFRPKDNFDYSELKSGIQKVMEELPEAQKQAIYMFYFEDMTTKEISEFFEVSESTIKGRIRYGKEKLKETIQSYEKQGKSFYGISPIPFLLWMLQVESENIIPARIQSASILQAMQSVPPALPKGTTVSKGSMLKIAGTTVSKKVAAGVVAATIVSGAAGGFIAYNTRDKEEVVMDEKTSVKNEEVVEKVEEKEESKSLSKIEEEIQEPIEEPKDFFAPILLDYQVGQREGYSGQYTYVTENFTVVPENKEGLELYYSFFDINGDGMKECIIVSQDYDTSLICWDIYGYEPKSKEIYRVLPDDVKSWWPYAGPGRARILLCKNGYIRYYAAERDGIGIEKLYHFDSNQRVASLIDQKNYDFTTGDDTFPFSSYEPLDIPLVNLVSDF